MQNNNNPYVSPKGEPLASISKPERNSIEATNSVNPPGFPRPVRLVRVFTFSYIPSLIVGITAVPVWVFLLISATPLEFRRTRGLDILELIFIFVTTLPSVLTCFVFSGCYCMLNRKKERSTIWPALVFGILSGLVFNAVTSITIIEYFFKW
ncbi:hypothetical protein N9069_00235 [bacterium]|nr:hypothetical protein [bacterium]